MKRLKNPYSKQLGLIRQLRREDRQRLFGIERWFSVFLAGFLMLLPAMFVRWIGGRFGYLGRKTALESWALAKPALLFAILFFDLGGHTWAAIFALVALLDLYAYLFGLVFLRHLYGEPASYRRSVLLLGINFIESLLAFSVFYLHTGSISRGSTVVRHWGDAIYFSAITAGTVGYGDIVPVTAYGRVLVVTQVLASFFFVVVILATFVARIFDKPTNSDPDAA